MRKVQHHGIMNNGRFSERLNLSSQPYIAIRAKEMKPNLYFVTLFVLCMFALGKT